MRKILLKSVLMASALFGASMSTSVAQAGEISEAFSGDAVVFQKTFSDRGKLQAMQFEKLPDDNDASSRADGPKGMPFLLKMKFSDSKQSFEASGSCFAEAEVMSCRIGCDDSGFTLKLDDDKTISLVNTDGFQLNGCSENKSAQVRKFEVDKENPIYILGKTQ